MYACENLKIVCNSDTCDHIVFYKKYQPIKKIQCAKCDSSVSIFYNVGLKIVKN